MIEQLGLPDPRDTCGWAPTARKPPTRKEREEPSNEAARSLNETLCRGPQPRQSAETSLNEAETALQ